MRDLFLFLLLVLVLPAQAQLLDSIGYFKQQEPRFIAKLDMRGSFISNRNVRIAGIKIGFEHAQRFQYGIGYSFLLSPVKHDRYINSELGVRSTRLRFGYIAPYVDYAFYQRGHWEVRIPVQIGFGSGSIIYEDSNGRKRKLLRSGVVLYEPAMTVQYRFLKYFGIGAGWGFRLVMYTRSGLDERITAPVYTFGFKVFFGEIWKDLR